MGNASVPVNESGIAWGPDMAHRYGNVAPQNFNSDPALRGGGTLAAPLNQDEHFAVWMRSAALPDFRKLWGRIDQAIPAGVPVTVTIANRLDATLLGLGFIETVHYPLSDVYT